MPRPSNVEMIFGDPWNRRGHKRDQERDKETARHNRADEEAATERIQKDRDVAEARNKTQLQLAKIRQEIARETSAHNRLVQERLQRKDDYLEARNAAEDEVKRAKLDREWKRQDRLDAQAILNHQDQITHWRNLELQIEYEHNYPPVRVTEKPTPPTEGYPGTPGTPGGIFGWGKTDPVEGKPSVPGKPGRSWNEPNPQPRPAPLPYPSQPVPPQTGTGSRFIMPQGSEPPVVNLPVGPIPPGTNLDPKMIAPPLPNASMEPYTGTEPSTVPLDIATPPDSSRGRAMVAPALPQTGTTAPDSKPNFWGGLANIMSPPNADAPGGIAQMIFQGIGKGIRAAQERKAAKILAQQQAPVPGVGPQMTAPPLPPANNSDWFGGGFNQPEAAPAAPPQTDNWMENSPVEAAPAAPVTVAPAAPPTATPKRPTRSIAKDYVQKFGEKAKDQLKLDGFDISGYAD